MTALIIIIIALVAFILYILFYPRRQKPFSHQPYLEALAGLLDGNDDLAIKKLKEAVHIDSNLIDAYIKLGNLCRKKGDMARAIQIHQSLTVRPTLKKDEEKKVYYALIDDYMADNRPNKAVSLLKEILKIDKHDRHARNMLLRIYENLENYADCITVFEEGGSNYQDDRRRAYYYAAMGKTKLREPDQDKDSEDKEKSAMNCFKKALKVFPDSLAGLYFLADLSKNHGDMKKVKEYYLKIINRYPDFTFLIQVCLEKVFYDLGAFDDIMHLYDKIFRQNPKNFTVGFALAELHEKKNEIESAREIYRKLTDIFPRKLQPRLRLLRLLTDDKNVKKEITEIDRAMTEHQYRCRVCNYETNKFEFICPKCHALESFYPYL